MLKLVLSVLLCFGAGASCISQEVPKEVELPFGLIADPALLYVGCGNLHLMLRDYELALEDFRRASVCAEQCDEDDAELAESMILFGQAIVYDNLHLRDKTEQAVTALILCVNNAEEYDSDEDDLESEEIGEELYKMMHRLALLAPSDDIREILISIIDSEWKN